MSDLEELTAKVRANFEGRTDKDERIQDALREGCEELSWEDWGALWVIDDSLTLSSSIDLPSDVEQLLAVLHPETPWYEIEIISPVEGVRILGSAVRYPAKCYRVENKLYFPPGVSEEGDKLRILYRRRLQFDKDGNLNVEKFKHLLVLFASAMVFESIEHGTTTANRWWALYERARDRMQESERMSGVKRRIIEEFRGVDPIIYERDKAWW